MWLDAWEIRTAESSVVSCPVDLVDEPAGDAVHVELVPLNAATVAGGPQAVAGPGSSRGQMDGAPWAGDECAAQIPNLLRKHVDRGIRSATYSACVRD